MKCVVDTALCAGHGLCASEAPDVFDLDDEGFNEAAGSTIDIAEEHEEQVRRAVGVCPESAITLSGSTVRG